MDDTKYTGDLWGDAPQPASTVQEQPVQQAVEDNNAPAQVETKPTPQESFSEMRAKTDKLQRERDEALQTLRRIEEYALQQQQQARQPAPDPEPDLDDDDYVEARHFKSKISNLEKQLNQFQQQQQQSSVQMQLITKYPDFERVVSPDNINKFIQLKPELAESFRQTPDSYNKAVAVYSLMKDLGIHSDTTYEPERERAQQNFNKPQTAAALKKTESALTHASEFSGSRLTEDRKKQIWADMQRNLRG